ncbi:hypothetical protein DL95DRAFT_387920, partial [Leptodontidium sp. 2 PMI_412]
MMLAIRRRHHEGRPFNFLEFLIATRLLKCTMKRDRFYSIIGMLTREDLAGAPQPDYACSIEDVSMDWSRHWLRKSLTLDLLSCVDSSRNSGSGDSKLPSWALDPTRLLQSLDQGESLQSYQEQSSRLYNATSSSIAQPFF